MPVGRTRPTALRLRPLTRQQRFHRRPEVIRNEESHRPSTPRFEAVDWQGVFVRRGTPEPIVERLADEIGAVLRQPEIVERLTGLGAPPSPMRPAQFEMIVRSDLEKWGRVVREAGIRLEG